VGKSFASELAKLAETCRYSSAIPVENLSRFVRKSFSRQNVTVGVGGSFSAACFAATLFSSKRASAVAKTTFDFYTSGSSLSDSRVLLFSGSGRNKDILSAFEGAQLREALTVFGLCARTKSPLRAAFDRFWEADFLDFDLPAGKDGFLATNSLLATSLVLAKAFDPEKWNDQAFLGIEEECVRPGPHLKSPSGKTSLLVLYGQWSHLAAVDIESKCSEAALAHVQLCDYRSFAHGRHNWIAKRGSETLVIPLIAAEDYSIASRTLKLLPRTTDIFPLETKASSDEAAIKLLVQSFKLINALGEARSIDPGRPGIPPFGSRVYQLKAFSTGKLFRPMRADCLNQAIRRKLDAGAYREGLTQAATNTLVQLEESKFGSLVFDFDGTLCSSKDRLDGVSLPLQPYLTRFLKSGFNLGIATGRGKSAREALRSFIPQKMWNQVTIGYYNGSILGSLADNKVPDAVACIDPEIQQIASKLVALPRFEEVCAMDVRPHQISLRSKQIGFWHEVSETVREIISALGSRARLLESSHSLDIVSISASKIRVVDRIRTSLAQEHGILCLGDRGDISGNDHELLSTPFSLSSHLVSASPTTGWNFAPPGWRCAQATLFYLQCLHVRGKSSSAFGNKIGITLMRFVSRDFRSTSTISSQPSTASEGFQRRWPGPRKTCRRRDGFPIFRSVMGFISPKLYPLTS
jgi:hypothetical protein